MDPESVFRSNLAVIDRVIGEICRRAHIRDADAEDFASFVKLSLIENDYDIIRRWEGRASLAGYLSVVIRRLLSSERVRRMGRWHASAEATRLGAAAILLETLMLRDGRSLDEALPLVQAVDASITRDAAVKITERLPRHEGRPRLVELELAEPVATADDRADDRALVSDARRLSDRAACVIRETMASWSDEDAMIVRFRFGLSMNVSDISRMLRIPQRPLYRRMERLLAALRTALVANGLDPGALLDLIGNPSLEIDFGLETWKNEVSRPSSEEAESR